MATLIIFKEPFVYTIPRDIYDMIRTMSWSGFPQSYPVPYLFLVFIIVSGAIFCASIQCSEWFRHYIYLAVSPWRFVVSFCHIVYPGTIFAKIVEISHVMLHPAQHRRATIPKHVDTRTPTYAVNSGACSEERCCRVCLDMHVQTVDGHVETQADFVTPCRCTGSIQYIHVECLRKSRIASHGGNKQCMTCKYVYEYEPVRQGRVEWIEKLPSHSVSMIDKIVIGVFIVIGMIVGTLIISAIDGLFNRSVCRGAGLLILCFEPVAVNALVIYGPVYGFGVCIAYGFGVCTFWITVALHNYKRYITILILVLFQLLGRSYTVPVLPLIVYVTACIILAVIGAGSIIDNVVMLSAWHGLWLVKAVYTRHYIVDYERVKNISPNIQSTSDIIE